MDRENVKAFYETQGWDKVGLHYRDAIINENLTEVAAEYVSAVRSRIKDFLGAGTYLLDVGPGPIQYREYLEYSQNFTYRVCVDLSNVALEQAKARIKTHGIFIRGDYLKIPTPEEAPFDGAALINVLYHVEKTSQAKLVRKMLEDLAVNKNLVVVYSNPQSLSTIISSILVGVKHFFERVALRRTSMELSNPIYFNRHKLSFWNEFKDVSEVQIRAWRTFSPSLEKLLFRKAFGGRYLLRLLLRLENFRFWYLISEYQMIILRKI